MFPLSFFNKNSSSENSIAMSTAQTTTAGDPVSVMKDTAILPDSCPVFSVDNGDIMHSGDGRSLDQVEENSVEPQPNMDIQSNEKCENLLPTTYLPMTESFKPSNNLLDPSESSVPSSTLDMPASYKPISYNIAQWQQAIKRKLPVMKSSVEKANDGQEDISHTPVKKIKELSPEQIAERTRKSRMHRILIQKIYERLRNEIPGMEGKLKAKNPQILDAAINYIRYRKSCLGEKELQASEFPLLVPSHGAVQTTNDTTSDSSSD